MSLRANRGLPSISRRDTMHSQVLGSVAEEAGQDDKEIVEAMRSSLPESEGHRAKVPPLEAPMPEDWARRAEQVDQDCEIWK
eukprot:4452908-Pleurochrysis_carterae.AAC.1